MEQNIIINLSKQFPQLYVYNGIAQINKLVALRHTTFCNERFGRRDREKERVREKVNERDRVRER